MNISIVWRCSLCNSSMAVVWQNKTKQKKKSVRRLSKNEEHLGAYYMKSALKKIIHRLKVLTFCSMGRDILGSKVFSEKELNFSAFYFLIIHKSLCR